jgi:hypothetical protein
LIRIHQALAFALQHCEAALEPVAFPLLPDIEGRISMAVFIARAQEFTI